MRARRCMYKKVLLLQYIIVLRQHRATLPEIGETIQRIDGLSRGTDEGIRSRIL